MPDESGSNLFHDFCATMYNVFDTPVTWFREKIVVPNQKHYPWYHQQYRRVPTIDECYTNDYVCMFEADEQWKRDKMVENEILSILRNRFEDCVMYETPDHVVKCTPLKEAYEEAAGHWFTKYGDLGAVGMAKECYMKQKHRMIWERRHGPVGSGMKDQSKEPAAAE